MIRIHGSAALLFFAVLSSAATPQRAANATVPYPRTTDAKQPSDTLSFTVLDRGQPVGSARKWATGGRQEVFEYRTPMGTRVRWLRTTAQTNTRGLPVILSTRNLSLRDSGEVESFRIHRGSAEWTRRGVTAARAGSDAAFYLPSATADVSHSLLVEALRQSPNKRLPLLPAGEAWLEREGKLNLAVDGKTLLLDQYTLHGLEFTRLRVWLDSAGALFSDLTLIRAGWDRALPELLQADARATAARSLALVRSLRRRPQRPVVIRGATLFDAASRRMRPQTTVVIEGERIRAVGPDGSVPVPRNAEVIDARGKILLPGLWDMHAHALGQLRWTLFHLAAGVTTVREMTLDTVHIRLMQALPPEELDFGPRIIRTGFINGDGGAKQVHVTTVEQARAIVQQYAKLGVPQLKLYNTLHGDLVPAIVDEARRYGMRVSGHIPKGMNVEAAVRSGFNEVNHIQFLALNFLSDSADFFHAPGRSAWTLDLSADSVQRLIASLKAHGVAVDPTLAVAEDLLTRRNSTVARYMSPYLNRLPALVQPRWSGTVIPPAEGFDQRYIDSFAKLRMFVKMLHDAGVPILAGTDQMPGFTLQRELEIYVEAGIPHADVLYLATLGAARVMRRDTDLGSIEVGKLADLVIIDGDPTVSIGALRKVVLTMKDGKMYDPVRLHEALGIRR